jgi:hypothetical protein
MVSVPPSSEYSFYVQDMFFYLTFTPCIEGVEVDPPGEEAVPQGRSDQVRWAGLQVHPREAR